MSSSHAPLTQHPRTGRVLVLGDNDLSALAIVRSLGRAGLDVHLVTFEDRKPTRHSRYAKQCHDFGHPLKQRQEFCESVVDFCRRMRPDLVIPTSDKALVPLMLVREQVNEFSYLVCPDDTGFEATNNKARTVQIAQQVGLEVPQSVLLRNIQEFASCNFEGLGMPLILKPVSSIVAHHASRHEVRVARTHDSFIQRAFDLVQKSPLLVQEMCPGFGVGISILARDGEVLAAFQHERVHEPPAGGAGSYRRSVPLSTETFAGVKAFCQFIRWTGPAMFEFKCDPANGRMVLMEVNGRFWGSLPLAIRAGVDFPKLLYDLIVTGTCQHTVEYRSPYYLRHTARDFWWFIANARTPSGRIGLTKVPLTRAFAEFGNILRLREGFDLESLRDPLPAMVSWWHLGGEFIAGLGSRITGKLHRRRLTQSFHKRAASGGVIDSNKPITNIVILCFGNINRSPFAAELLAGLLRKAGHTTTNVISAGFYPMADRMCNPLTVQSAATFEVNLSEHRSKVITTEMLAEADLVVAMDLDNIGQLQELDHSLDDRAVLLSMCSPGEKAAEIADPFGEEKAAMQQIFTEISGHVHALANRILQRG